MIIDPFITGNPLTKAKIKNIRVQYVLVTHSHFDHLGDTVAIARRNHATVIASYELAQYLSRFGVRTFAMNVGGSRRFRFGSVQLTQAPTVHPLSRNIHPVRYTPDRR